MLQGGRGEIEESARVVQLMIFQPLVVSTEDEADIVQLVTETTFGRHQRNQFHQLVGRKLVTLHFTQEQAELLREPGQASCCAKDSEIELMPREQGAQDHDTAFFREDARRCLAEFAQDEIRETIKRDDLQA